MYSLMTEAIHRQLYYDRPNSIARFGQGNKIQADRNKSKADRNKIKAVRNKIKRPRKENKIPKGLDSWLGISVFQ